MDIRNGSGRPVLIDRIQVSVAPLSGTPTSDWPVVGRVTVQALPILDFSRHTSKHTRGNVNSCGVTGVTPMEIQRHDKTEGGEPAR